jgi:hypothetical protein
MKKKTINYLLGLVALLTWGMIFYKIFNAAWGSDDVPPPPVAHYREKAYDDFAVKKDTAKPALNYRDPFKLSVTRNADTTKRMPVVKTRALAPPAPRTDWSFIKYSGYIANPSTKKVISILIINGRSAMLKEGESTDRVKLIKNMRDSVQVYFQHQTMFIPRSTATI